MIMCASVYNPFRCSVPHPHPQPPQLVCSPLPINHSPTLRFVRYAVKVRTQRGAATSTKLNAAVAPPAIVTQGFAAFLINYNTVESILLACAVCDGGGGGYAA